MYYCLYGDEMPFYDICFNKFDINKIDEVDKEMNKLFDYMINNLSECKIKYDSCGIIPCIGLFINELDLKKLDECKNLYQKLGWSLSKIDILPDYVCINLGFLYYKHDNEMKQLLSPRITNPYFVVKYDEFIKSINKFKYKLVNASSTFGEFKYNFIINRTLGRIDYMSPDLEIVYFNPRDKYDTKVYDFKKRVKK